jgi:hypothetical protein
MLQVMIILLFVEELVEELRVISKAVKVTMVVMADIMADVPVLVAEAAVALPEHEAHHKVAEVAVV